MQTCRRNNSAFKIPLTPFGYVFQNCLLVFAHISQRNGFCRWPVKLVLTHQSSAECCHGQKAQTKSQWWSGSAYPFTIVPPNEAPAWVCERLSVCLVTGSPTVCNKHCDTQLPLFLYHCFCLRTLMASQSTWYRLMQVVYMQLHLRDKKTSHSFTVPK